MAIAPTLAHQRWQTLRAAALLVAARMLVRWLPLSSWRASLGQLADDDNPGAVPDMERGQILQARALARRVERSAMRLPGHSKCLPQAVALQWLLRAEAIASTLVIAIHRHDREGDHAYHAWVQCGGEMVIGQCDRENYSSVASFAQFG
ncbi:lasso peptide biosynthesis B2 protein [Altererythrobacter sp. Z27]|uniref:lasso peptide biosynthesis B2 protein n=1 Tax=Altererythrobacter sp. Z27 TaxID=3461147 RepID=UPI0040445C16